MPRSCSLAPVRPFLAALLALGCTVPDLTDVDTYSCPWVEANVHEPDIAKGECLRADVEGDGARVRTLDTFDNYPEDGRDETVEPSCGAWTTCATADPMWGEVIETATGLDGDGAFISTWRCGELPGCEVAFDPAWRGR